MITDVGTYFSQGCGRCPRFATPDCSTRRWAPGLAQLRRICLEAGLAETLKWSHPCYMAEGRNIAILGALRGELRLNFFNAALLKDPQGLLRRQGPNTAHPEMLSFTDNLQVLALEPVVRAYLLEAVDCARAGAHAPRPSQPLVLPAELVQALQADSQLAAAFAALTPGRQRSHVLVLNAARRPETRRARIERLRGRILAGKGAQEA